MNEQPILSVSLSSTHHDDGPRRMIERTKVAHASGFAALTIGDHHDMPVPYAQNTPMLGRLLAEWPDRPAGCLFLVPLWKPLLMAEQIGTLAAIHDLGAPDREFIVQTGLGWGEAQFTNLGARMRRRGADIDAALPVVKALLAGEEVDDEYFGLRGARVGLRSPTSYSWWIGGGVKVAIERAARLGDCWYTGPGPTDAELAEQIAYYRSLGGTHVAMRRDAIAAPDDAAAMQRADDRIAGGYRGMRRDALLAGGPDRIAERLAAFAALGVDEVVIRCADREQRDALVTLETLGSVI